MTAQNIQVIDFAKMQARDPATMAEVETAVREVGFLILDNTPLGAARVKDVIESYRSFFALPEPVKQTVNMARTGANRGWGAPHSEQVDPMANPDFKEVFDCGFQLDLNDPARALNLSVYADNLWPEDRPDFRENIQTYYGEALDLAKAVLGGITAAIGQDETYFADKFSRPMALLRGNYYPPRPDYAGDNDFGIAAHTDYGCITLLAGDGVPGLEVQMPDDAWVSVAAKPGQFVINFGEMLEMWTNGAVRATPHRVIGGSDERLSIPMFFNPNHDANVAPLGSGKTIEAGAHLARRFNETYVHLQKSA